MTIEFFPVAPKSPPIYYEVKLGGLSKSFVRTSSLGDWKVPVHHYRLFVTALVKTTKGKSTKEDIDEKETLATEKLFSSFVKDSFSVFVNLPNSYGKSKSRRFPTVYLLDANAYFDNISSTIQQLNKNHLLPEMILVGIGYKDFLSMDSLRIRDYTFPKASVQDSFPVSGGADKFRHFLENELIPHIDRDYLTDTTERTLLGHSFGGFFTLFVMENDLEENNTVFQKYVAASPSLNYQNGYLIKQYQGLPEMADQKNTRFLYLTTGGLEGGETGSVTFNLFLKTLSDPKFRHIRIKHEIYPDTDHMETGIPTFERGMQLTR